MHGARNDFIVIDRRADATGDLVRFAIWACDRRSGVGADGVIAIEASGDADARMRTINADGSEAEMCGNGIRCAARWLDETQPQATIVFETIAGRMVTEIVERVPDYAVRVGMGVPRIRPLNTAWLERSWFVNLGNPHVVVICEDPAAMDLERLALKLQSETCFPSGTNVHLCAPEPHGSLRVRHWERGVGITQACGTGAVACAAVAIVQRLSGSPVQVAVPGGRLVVEWDGEGEAYLTGPAVRVFDADIDPRFLR